MSLTYRVWVKATDRSPWRDTGIVESNKSVAERVWASIVRDLRYHAFKLEYQSYGVAIER
jgi:hypothetical protein